MQLVVVSSCLGASKGMGEAFPRSYPEMVPAPFSQDAATAELKTAGCQTCHAKAEHKTMHKAPSVVLGCTDCHGGNANVQWAGDLWVAPEASEASVAAEPAGLGSMDAASRMPLEPRRVMIATASIDLIGSRPWEPCSFLEF